MSPYFNERMNVSGEQINYGNFKEKGVGTNSKTARAASSNENYPSNMNLSPKLQKNKII